MSRQAASIRILLALALIFFVISIFNAFIAIKLILIPTAKIAAQLGIVMVCIKQGITMNINESFSMFEGDNFTLYVNYTNPGSRTLVFSDNASIFNINSSTGLINFTASVYDVGNNTVRISLTELDGICDNTTLTKFSDFVITGNSFLLIWDDTDARGGNHIRHLNQTVMFFANYSNSIGAPINGSLVYCNITFNSSGTLTTPVNMHYNSSKNLYYYNQSFYSYSNYSFYVFCYGMSAFFLNRNATDNFTIANNPPVLTHNLPNETWNMNTILIDHRLSDYFMDPDGDPLVFTATFVPNIKVTIDNITSTVTYTPDANWYGNRSVIFRATDPYGLYAESNIVFLEVVFVQPTPSPTIPSSTGGGGGGGGGGGLLPCEEYWECTPFGPCLPTEIRTRKCSDLALCGTDYSKPNESERCEYGPTCKDSIMNGLETGIDCGGPCLPCPNCSDTIQNQGEEGIDCGGPCPIKCPTCNDGFQNGQETGIDCGGICEPCANCTDGIKNEGEEGIDCGGPCRKCTEEEKAAQQRGILFYISALMTLSIFLIALVFLASYLSQKLKKPIPKLKVTPMMSIEELIEQTLKQLAALKRRLATEEPLLIRDSLLDIMRSFIMAYARLEEEITFEEVPQKTSLFKERLTPKLVEELLRLSAKYSEIGYKSEVPKAELNALIAESINFVILCGRYSEQLKTKEALELFQTQLPVLESLLKLNNMRVSKQVYNRLSKAFENLPKKEKETYYKRLKDAHNKLLELIKSYKK